MEESTTQSPPADKFSGKRPPGLAFLCILTFIGSGASAISSIFVALVYNMIPYIVKDSPFADAASLTAMIKSAGPLFFALMGLLYLGSLAGAIFMFKLKKIGFHFYILAQLFMLLLPSLMIDGYTVPASNLLLTGSFVLAYAVNIRTMR